MARTDPRPNYGSKRRVRKDGYIDIYFPSHPLAREDGYIFEHRMLAWDAGLFNDSTLEVHHKDLNRSNNILENFEIKSSSDHSRDHQEERGTVTNQYGTFLVKPREKRQSAPKIERICVGCSRIIPSSKRRDAKYCTSNCQVRHWKQMAKE